MVSEANEPGSESGKRSDDRRGAARGTRAGSWSPQEGGASTPLAAPGSLAAATIVTRTPSWGARGARALLAARPRPFNTGGALDPAPPSPLNGAHAPRARDR